MPCLYARANQSNNADHPPSRNHATDGLGCCGQVQGQGKFFKRGCECRIDSEKIVSHLDENGLTEESICKLKIHIGAPAIESATSVRFGLYDRSKHEIHVNHGFNVYPERTLEEHQEQLNRTLRHELEHAIARDDTEQQRLNEKYGKFYY